MAGSDTTKPVAASLEDLRRRNREAELGGGEKRVKQQHDAGKLTARERIDLLFDSVKSSLDEIL